MTRRSLLVTYILWFFFGVFGVHRLYLGHIGWAVVYFLTGGLFLIGWIVDLFLNPSYVAEYNARLRTVGLI
ncbi:MAG: TM2 domain-containing protein [Verrucomicrobiaceae bacterium]